MISKFGSRVIANTFWILTGTIIILSSFESSISLNDNLIKNARFVFPEGWGFFTKDPKESLVDIYRINEKDSSLTELDLANTSMENYLGFSREARIKGYEMSMLLSKIPQSYWKKDTTYNLNSHINDTTFVAKLPNKFRYMNSGQYLLKMRKPVPWAWSAKGQEKYTPYKTLKIAIHE